MDLVLHLGMAKTGTTTVQSLLSEEPGYLGKFDQRETNSPGKVFQTLIGGGYERFKGNIFDWAEDINQKGQMQGVNRLILSDENLLGSRKIPAQSPSEIRMDLAFDDISKERLGFLTASHLKYLSEEVWKYGDVKAVIVLRNQAEWLASRYAQSAAMITNPSQKSFEEWVSMLLETNAEYLDWSKRVANLHEALGEHNVKVLLFEDISKLDFWEDFSEFFGLGEKSNFCQLGVEGGARNALRDNDGAWRLKTKNAENNKIVLPVDLKNQVDQTVDLFNRRLGKQILRGDLKALGY